MTQQNDFQKEECLDENFFSSILKKEFDHFDIENLSIKNALPKGENYASVINRVTIDIKDKDGKKHQKSYLLKKENDGQSLAMSKNMQLFRREQEMFEVVIPKFEKLFNEVGESVTFGAKCLKATIDPNYVVLEDLKPRGFVNVPRQNGLDLIHSKAVLDKLAQFHAASACVYQKEGPYKPLLTRGIFVEENFEMFEMMNNSFNSIIIDSIKTWKGCEQYEEKIKNILRRKMELLIKSEEAFVNEFNVLNHGDLWCNNIMFQYDDAGGIKEVYFVDYQICRWGSPALDLQYFIFSSCNLEIKVKEFDFMIKYYHGQLVKYLKLLHYPGELPTLVDLHIQLLKRGSIGINTSLGIMSVILADPSEDASIESAMQDTDAAMAFKKGLYSNPRFVKAIQTLLPYLDNRGLLDY